MLPEFYHKCISQLLTPRQYTTLRILVLMLQSYRTIKIEKLAALLPIPIKYQSRRRHLQRFLGLPEITTKCIWFPIIKKWLKINQTKKRVCYLAINNLSNLKQVIKAYKKRMGMRRVCAIAA